MTDQPQTTARRKPMRYPNILNADRLIAYAGQNQCGLRDGRYVEARPFGFQSFSYRIKATWLVWTGRADALTWTGQ